MSELDDAAIQSSVDPSSSDVMIIGKTKDSQEESKQMYFDVQESGFDENSIVRNQKGKNNNDEEE